MAGTPSEYQQVCFDEQSTKLLGKCTHLNLQSGSVISATKISPFFILDISARSSITRTGPVAASEPIAVPSTTVSPCSSTTVCRSVACVWRDLTVSGRAWTMKSSPEILEREGQKAAISKIQRDLSSSFLALPVLGPFDIHWDRMPMMFAVMLFNVYTPVHTGRQKKILIESDKKHVFRSQLSVGRKHTILQEVSHPHL